MKSPLFMLTIPGLRLKDLQHMPFTSSHLERGEIGGLQHSFPSVTWPAQTTMLTGTLPQEHGVIANGFFWRDSNRVEMWTAPNSVIQRPQIWDRLRELHPALRSAAWFPMLSKKCNADYVSMPAPIHKPDGSEELWCYTKPQEFYGDLLANLGHFPLQHFWGPIANIKSSMWICQSAKIAAERFLPDFFYVYLPHLDYAAQKSGPDSPAAIKAVSELDQLLSEFIPQIEAVYAERDSKWVILSEYVISSVDHVTYPNRVLREAGLLHVRLDDEGREVIDFENTPAWVLVDHQLGHVFVKDRNSETISAAAAVLRNVPGIDRVLVGDERREFGVDHERSGDLVLISTPNSWQAYYWWLDDQLAPTFAKTVDIHRKPGYDPVELFIDMPTKSIPLDATLIKGSHGIVTPENAAQAVFATVGCRQKLNDRIQDTAICDWVLREFQ
jgi:hypothetical protein